MTKEILIAESDRVVQKELERIFEVTDYKIILSESEEALIRARLFRPDLIIGGKEVYRAVKGDPEFKEVPFILLLNLFEDLSDKERESLQVDGIISRPLNGDEVLNSIDRAMEIGRSLPREEYGKEEEERRAVMVEESLSLGEVGEGEEEEIIELVDVVEEPEAKMSITDFAISPKEEPFREIPTLGPWTKEEEKPIPLEHEEKRELREKEEWVERGEGGEEKTPEEEFFEKIELEEILQKVERLEPMIEKEWAAQEVEREEKGIEPTEPLKEAPPFVEITPEKTAPEMELEELSEEEFPEAFLEELEEELEKLEEGVEEVQEEIKAERLEEEEIFEPVEKEPLIEVPPSSMVEEARVEPFPIEKEVEKEIIPIGEELPAKKVPEEELPSPLLSVEKRIEEIVAKGVGEMMQDFMTKIIPEITQHLLTLTLDRIERMVRDVVPEIAEKAIQEEIKRLEKGETK
jgi:hypothetical protein